VKQAACDRWNAQAPEYPSVQECRERLQRTDSGGAAEDIPERLAIEVRVRLRAQGTGTTSGENTRSESERDTVADERVDESGGVPGLHNVIHHRRPGAEVDGGGGEQPGGLSPVFRSSGEMWVGGEDFGEILRGALAYESTGVENSRRNRLNSAIAGITKIEIDGIVGFTGKVSFETDPWLTCGSRSQAGPAAARVSDCLRTILGRCAADQEAVVLADDLNDTIDQALNFAGSCVAPKGVVENDSRN